MNLDEKIAQMHGTMAVDGIWRTTRNERLGIPELAMTDGPRGVGALTGKATAFPVAMARGATWDPELERRVGQAIGAEVRGKGGNVLLAPTINILRHPRWGRAQETYGEDTYHLARMAVAFIEGAQSEVVASVKHFAANSIENTRFSVDVRMDERTLREIYLPHFRAAVREAAVGTVMTAYNQVNGFFASENAHLLRDILKGEWEFEGFVESDWLLGTRSTVPAALAGLDIEMPSPNFFGDNLLDAVEDGSVPEATIDEAVRRILRVDFCFGLDLEREPLEPEQRIGSSAHTELAREAAREGIVLLRNREAILPLDPNQSVAIVGALAGVANLGDTGSSNVSPTYVVTPVDGIGARAARSVYVGSHDNLSTGDLEQVAAADTAVVFVGLTAADEGEGVVSAGDRVRLELSEQQEQLVRDVAAANPRTVVVLEGGSAIVVESWVDATAAVLMAWYPGQEGGNAIAEILFGEADPSGRLPISFARSEDDLPEFDNVSPVVDYGYFHGYRWLDLMRIEPRWPFGHGLSYTTFSYADLTASAATVAADGTVAFEVDVTNTGMRPGVETVQLYVAAVGSAVARAERDLRGFAKVALEPGETRTVRLELAVGDLAYFDEGRSAWRVEPTDYIAAVGSSSRDLPLQTTFRVVSE
jgi:beta-glucosidase